MVRGSLGRAIDLDATELREAYGFYAIPVQTFLALDAWVPHQTLLAEGKLVEVKAGDSDAEVIFCSHQWTSFDHPDPANEQLKALQSVLTNLMAGKTDVVSNGMLDAVYQYRMITTGAEWKRKLPSMYLWIDYISIPQPGALMSEASAELVSELDKDQSGVVDMNELVDADLTKAKARSASTTDHRLLQANADEQIAALVEQLKAAVDSIPSYIERSSMMWVVVPPVKHQSIDDAICDFASWRRRGWCRMEFAACKLACGDDMPLMVIKSEKEPPEYFNPCDMFKLCASRGEFTVDDDKAKVNKTLVTMLEAKAKWYAIACTEPESP